MQKATLGISDAVRLSQLAKGHEKERERERELIIRMRPSFFRRQYVYHILIFYYKTTKAKMKLMDSDLFK